jgi:hypothetical protein
MLLEGVRAPFDYSLWDADKHQMCVCDAGFSGIDCSQRSCPRSDDPLTPATSRWCGGMPCKNEVQSFRLSSAGDTTFRFAFTDTRNNSHIAYATVNTLVNSPGVVPADQQGSFIAGPTSNAGIIMNALRTIPSGALQLVEVSAVDDASDGGALQRTFEITFLGFSGPQYPIGITSVTGAGKVAVAPFVKTIGTFEDVECSGRGLCDGAAGLCKCAFGGRRRRAPYAPTSARPSPSPLLDPSAGFSGYYGVACEYQNALATSATGALKN